MLEEFGAQDTHLVLHIGNPIAKENHTTLFENGERRKRDEKLQQLTSTAFCKHRIEWLS